MRLLTFCYQSDVSSALTGGWTIPNINYIHPFVVPENLTSLALAGSKAQRAGRLLLLWLMVLPEAWSQGKPGPGVVSAGRDEETRNMYLG